MIKRTLEISQGPARLSVKNRQLLIRREDHIAGQIPIEDLGVVMVDHGAVTYTHAALADLAASGAVVVLCGPNHLPTAIVQPLADHTQVVWRIQEQLGATVPTRKRLWQQVVQAKIRGQANNLNASCPGRRKLLDLARNVRSGDPANVESHAARVYWKHWLPDGPFRRDPTAIGINSFLNYGYAVLRAAVARAIVAAGLLPAIGLHHCNRSNGFCLADDMVEPFRPLVDARVRVLQETGHVDLTQSGKASLLELLGQPVELNGDTGPLMVNVHRMIASLVRCLRGESRQLEIPRPCS